MNKLFSTNNYPTQKRAQTDTCCILMFTLILTLFFGFGGYVLIEGVHSYRINPKAITQKYPFIQNQYLPTLWVVLTMAGLGVKLTFLFFFISKILPKILTYFAIFGSIATLGGITVVAKLHKYDGVALTSGIFLFMYLVFLFHSFLYRWDTISSFIKLSGKILKHNWRIYTIPFVIGSIGFLFTAFFLSNIFAIIQLNADNIATPEQSMLIIGIQGLFYSIFVFLFYFSMVFLVSTNVMFRHLQTDIQKSCIGIRWLLKYHIGSLMLHTFMAPITKVIEIIVDLLSGKSTQIQSNNSSLEPVSLKTTIHGMNHSAFSMMALTGFNFIKSSHLVALLYHRFPSLHQTARKVNSFILISGVIMCVVLPAFLGFVYMQKYKHLHIGMLVSIIIILISFLSVLISLSVLTQSITAGLIYAQIQRMSNGIIVGQINQQAKEIYEQLFLQAKQEHNQMNMLKKHAQGVHLI